jgi:hypothetical protein
VFRYAVGLARLERQDAGQLMPMMLTVDRLLHLMAQVSAWYIRRG